LQEPGGERFVPPGGAVPLVVDTGLEYTILTMPPALRQSGLTLPGSATFKSGIEIKVEVPTRAGSAHVALGYEFHTGALRAPAYTPTRVVWGANDDTLLSSTPVATF
jgi:hypothetical protein